MPPVGEDEGVEEDEERELGGTDDGGADDGTLEGALEGGMEVVPEKVEPRSPHLMLE